MVVVYCEEESDDDGDNEEVADSSLYGSVDIQSPNQPDVDGSNNPEKHTELEKQRTKFLIHKSYACYHSPYFNCAFNGSFLEGTTQSITVKANPEIFGILAEWMYSQKLQDSCGKKITSLQAALVWVLADEFLMPELQNRAIKVFYSQTNLSKPDDSPEFTGVFAPSQFEYLWKKTRSKSPLRKIILENMVENMTFNYKEEKFEKMSNSLPKEFLAEYASLQGRQMSMFWNEEEPRTYVTLDIQEYFVQPVKKH